jgi:hypothetical protein
MGGSGITVPHHNGVVTEKGALILVWAAGDGTIRAQKITPEGEVLWPEGGVQVGLSAAEEPQVTTDGFGGAIIAWAQVLCEYERDLIEIHAQRIDSQGNLLWGEGRLVHAHCRLTKFMFPVIRIRMTASAAGKAIITVDALRTSPFDRHIFAQKIDSQGNLKWQEGGVVMSRFHYGASPYHSIVTDDADGGIIAFFTTIKGMDAIYFTHKG